MTDPVGISMGLGQPFGMPPAPNPLKEAKNLIGIDEEMAGRTIVGDRGVIAIAKLQALASVMPDAKTQKMIEAHAERWMRIIISHNGLSREQYLRAYQAAKADADKAAAVSQDNGAPVK